MRAISVVTVLLMVTLSAAVRPAAPDTLEVLGQAGVLGEWELTAKIMTTDDGKRKVFSGPLVMKHVGLCTQDGPEIKQGELQLQMLSLSRVRATLVVAGVTCTYAGRKSDAYNGVMRCPDQRAVPLLLWLK